MAAVDRKTDLIVSFHNNAGIDGFPLQSPHHMIQAGIGKGAEIFTQMAAKTPLLAHNDFFVCIALELGARNDAF